MKVGIVVHGPYIIDSGYAIKVINQIADSLRVRVNKENLNCILGGTTGRTAVIDARLENLIDISKKRLPSESIKFLQSIGCKIIFLIHYGKSATTGHVFGLKVFQNSNNPPLIEIERPGEIDGSVISWDPNPEINYLAKDIANNLNLNLVNPNNIIKKYNNPIQYENIGNNENIENMGNVGNIGNIGNIGNTENIGAARRKIDGVSPNENILINGIFVGTSKGAEIVLVANNNILTNIIGAEFKAESSEKLGKIDLNKAIVKTGLLRKSNISGKVRNTDFNSNNEKNTNSNYGNKNNNNNNNNNGNNSNSNINENNNIRTLFKIGFIDNPMANIHDLKNKDVVIAIGDETTLLASDILYRFDVPVIGLVTGIVEKLVQKTHIHKNSIIIKVTDTGHTNNNVNNANNTGKAPLNLNSKINHISNEIKNSIFNDSVEYCNNNNNEISTLTNQIINIINKNGLNYKINNNNSYNNTNDSSNS
ncbi:MAG: DUF2117 domain-containing protein [Methanobacteriaceae archaeon]